MLPHFPSKNFQQYYSFTFIFSFFFNIINFPHFLFRNILHIFQTNLTFHNSSTFSFYSIFSIVIFYCIFFNTINLSKILIIEILPHFSTVTFFYIPLYYFNIIFLPHFLNVTFRQSNTITPSWILVSSFNLISVKKKK